MYSLKSVYVGVYYLKTLLDFVFVFFLSINSCQSFLPKLIIFTGQNVYPIPYNTVTRIVNIFHCSFDVLNFDI